VKSITFYTQHHYTQLTICSYTPVTAITRIISDVNTRYEQSSKYIKHSLPSSTNLRQQVFHDGEPKDRAMLYIVFHRLQS